MKTYQVTLELDEKWLEAINKLTDVDIYEGETCTWIELKEITK
jgi:hypothetical protein